MARSLVIVESPAKAKTINKFLGTGFMVKACMGHVRDLPKKHARRRRRARLRADLRGAAGQEEDDRRAEGRGQGADVVYLATDPDREGEAIAWHLVEALKIGRPTRRPPRRSTRSPRRPSARRSSTRGAIDMRQGRRPAGAAVLDRLVGYKLSPLLWKKVRRGLSAGRVQSVAVRLIVDREREIEAFVAEEYWTIAAHLAGRSRRRPRRSQGRRQVRRDRRYAEIAAKTGRRCADQRERPDAVLDDLVAQARSSRREDARDASVEPARRPSSPARSQQEAVAQAPLHGGEDDEDRAAALRRHRARRRRHASA